MALEDIYTNAITSGEWREEEYARLHWTRYEETWRIVQRLLPKKGKILEIGTLLGHIAMGLKWKGYQVETVDIKEEADRYRSHLAKYGIPEYSCDLASENLPFPDSKFDLIVFTEVLEHINPLSLQHVVTEISRVLRTGGFLVLSTPNAFNLGARIRMLIGRKYLCLEHIREYSLQEVKAILEGKNIFCQSGGLVNLTAPIESHLRIVEAYYSLIIDRIKFGSKRIRLARKLMLPFKLAYPRLRSSIFLIAVKE